MCDRFKGGAALDLAPAEAPEEEAELAVAEAAALGGTERKP
jgi:hypothetical protein